MGLKNKLFLLVIFICLGIVGILVSSNLFINKVRIGGKAYQCIELKSYVIDIVARTRVNWNMLNSVTKTQIFDEYDEENSATGIAQTITDSMNEMEMIFSSQSSGDGAEKVCLSCHANNVTAELVEVLSAVKNDWKMMTSLLLGKILPALKDDDKETAYDLFTGEFDDNYIAVMADSKKIVDMNRAMLEDMKVKTTKEVNQFSIYYTGAGILMLLIILTIAGITVNQIVKKIKEVVSEIDQSCSSITTETRVTTNTIENSAEIASEMAASIEETSASLEELTAMVRQNDENATETEHKMKDNMEIIEEANADVEGMKENMHTIKSDSDKISDIITEIDGIAFQTNLLALNAAVEAARAGEAGAGFAVVADEVRNLAQRTAESARNSQDLIEMAIGNVNNGLTTVDKVDKAMSKISESIKATALLIEEISKASHQQSEGIGQINSATAGMESQTLQFAAGSEELAAASQAILAQTNVLYSTIGGLVELVDGKGRGNSSASGATASVRSAEAPVKDEEDVPSLPEA